MTETHDSDVDAALDDSLRSIPAESSEVVESRTDGQLPSPDEWKCTTEEAEALVEKATSAANAFLETMYEIIRLEAWYPLGCKDPGELISRRLEITNPATGKPYGTSHLKRMGNVAWMLWAISDAANIDPALITLPERRIREIRGGQKALGEFVGRITKEFEEAKKDDPGYTAAPERVQQVIDENLAAQLGDTDDDHERRRVTTDDNAFLSEQGEQQERADGRRSGGGRDADDAEEDAPARPRRQGNDDEYVDGEDYNPLTAQSLAPAEDAFEGNEDHAVDAPDITAGEALVAVRAADKFDAALRPAHDLDSDLRAFIKFSELLPDSLDAWDGEPNDLISYMESEREFLDRFLEAAEENRNAIDRLMVEAEEAGLY